jgi:hypothetical protein
LFVTETVVVVVIAALVAIVCVLVSVAVAWKMTARQMTAVPTDSARAMSDRQQPFVEVASALGGLSAISLHQVFGRAPGMCVSAPCSRCS